MIDTLPDFPDGCIGGARCTFCGSIRPEGDDQIAVGPTIDYEGIIAICGNCVRELAAEFGWISPEKAEELEEHIKTQQSTLATTALELASCNESRRALTLHNAELITQVDELFEDEDEYDEGDDEWSQS